VHETDLQAPAVAPTERLEPSETEYLAEVRAGVQQAQQCETQAEELRQQAAGLNGAHASFVRYLCRKYRLDHQADQITPDGQILRAVPSPPPPNGIVE